MKKTINEWKNLTEKDLQEIIADVTKTLDPKMNWVAYTGQGGVENIAENNPEAFIQMYELGQITPNNQDSQKHLQELYELTKSKLK